MVTDARCVQVSDRAKKRGKTQLGTLGAGNHYVEVQVILLTFGDSDCTGHVHGSVTACYPLAYAISLMK